MSSTRFKVGTSGNPKGRPKGSTNRNKSFVDGIGGNLPRLIEVIMTQALQGEAPAQRLILERLIPIKKSESSLVTIEGIDQAATLTRKATLVMSAITNGEIPPDIGSNLIVSLANTAKIAEVDELLKRVEALENNDQS